MSKLVPVTRQARWSLACLIAVFSAFAGLVAAPKAHAFQGYLTAFNNLYGTATLVGGAAWSAWIFWRKRILLHRTIGNILIAVGAILPAFGGAFSRFGLSGALYLSELLGAVLIFIGFVRAITPMGSALLPAVLQPAER